MRMNGFLLFMMVALSIGVSAVKGRDGQTKVMTVGELLAMEPVEADFVIPYGQDPLQFGELRLPEGDRRVEGRLLVEVVIWLMSLGSPGGGLAPAPLRRRGFTRS